MSELGRIISDPAGRGTEVTETFSGDGDDKTFVLTNKHLMFIVSITVGGVAQKWITDFDVDYGTNDTGATIIFVSAPATGTNNISVTYRHGSKWIYPDFPRNDATFPRMSLFNVGGDFEKSGGVGDKVVFIYPVFRIQLHVRDGKDYTIGGYKYVGDKLLDYLNSELEAAIHSIRDNNTIGNLIDIKINSPESLGLNEEYDILRSGCRITTHFKKSYS